MKCPFCGFEESKVSDSRPTEEGTKTRRRRECLSCNKRFTTYEMIETIPIMVKKSDNSIVLFDKSKIIHGILLACQKRPVTVEQIDAIANLVENEIQNSLNRQVSSLEIGNLVMHHLKELDDIAYVRFASVYRQFSDLNSFMSEVKTILKDR